MFNGPIDEAIVLVQLEENEQTEVDFHPHYHHHKLELETYPLEEISTQNGPPKKINKIIFLNFGGRKEKTTFLFVF